MNAHVPLGLRQRQRQETRRQLVEAGLRVVAQHGFSGATTAAIARETGKAHGTVFLHFPTRDALVAELVEEVGRAMSRQLSKLGDRHFTVDQVLDAHLEALGEHEVLYAQLLRDAPGLPMAARARLFELQSGIASRFREAHARDVAKAAARPLNSVGLANTWIAVTNHYLINRDLFAPGRSVIATRGAEIKAQMLEILKP